MTQKLFSKRVYELFFLWKHKIIATRDPNVSNAYTCIAPVVHICLQRRNSISHYYLHLINIYLNTYFNCTENRWNAALRKRVTNTSTAFSSSPMTKFRAIHQILDIIYKRRFRLEHFIIKLCRRNQLICHERAPTIIQTYTRLHISS